MSVPISLAPLMRRFIQSDLFFIRKVQIDERSILSLLVKNILSVKPKYMSIFIFLFSDYNNFT